MTFRKTTRGCESEVRNLVLSEKFASFKGNSRVIGNTVGVWLRHGRPLLAWSHQVFTSPVVVGHEWGMIPRSSILWTKWIITLLDGIIIPSGTKIIPSKPSYSPWLPTEKLKLIKYWSYHCHHSKIGSETRNPFQNQTKGEPQLACCSNRF